MANFEVKHIKHAKLEFYHAAKLHVPGKKLSENEFSCVLVTNETI